ncbi:MAG TPA: NAD(P)H-quinone oxidoreductase [Myxococcota bacterium]|nr:NAD(P)H-quinone oxidoreductase [Myxococcota bacterium]
MRAVTFDAPGDESVLHWSEVPAPGSGPRDLRIRVRAAGVNRADLMQRQGLYPPPPGASPILGLECSGVVSEVGSEVRGWRTGERAMALLAGGGYAEEVVVDAGSAMHVPERLSDEQAAALPEVALTVFLNVFQLGALPEGGVALVHGGGSGIGTAAIKMVKASGGRIVVTAGSDDKCNACLELGADRAVNYRMGDFVAAAKEATGGRGVDVVLDSIGAPYLEKNLSALAIGGRLVEIGLMGGAKGELNLGVVVAKRVSILGSTLRARPAAEKAAIVAGFLGRFGRELEAGALDPVVDRVLPMERAAEAHRAMKASEHFGKIVLRAGP